MEKDKNKTKQESPLRICPVFRQLTRSEQENLELHKQTGVYKKGEIVYKEGTRVRGVYCVQAGVVKHYKTGYDGKEQIIKFSKPGDIFGFRPVLSGDYACTTTQVIDNANLCLVSSTDFLQLLNQNSYFAMDIIKLSCQELGNANNFILDIAQKSVRERLAEVLLALDNNFGRDKDGNLKIQLTREEFAGIVGTATESVIRLLSELKKEKVIELNKRKIRLLNLSKLKQIANL
ncbi:MAG: Crp/Fnr family transcriptional regulator [Bacteroidia bacterium]|nr:MAG: Crp/Fnr family transcriptional regulator [Bacteroidia bacterium]